MSDSPESTIPDKRKRKREESEMENEESPDSAASGENSQSSTQSIDEEFRCNICLSTLTEPYTIIPCLHSFDKECLVSWWEAHSTCPACQSLSTSAKPAFQLKSIITRLNQRRRIEVTLPITHKNDEIFPSRANGHMHDNDQDDDLVDALNDDDGDDADTTIEASQLLWPCLACSPGNPTGYACPNPIISPSVAEIQAAGLDPALTTAPGRYQRKLALTDPSLIGRPGVSHHSQCNRCGNYVPNTFPNEIHCAGSSCNGVFCSNVDPGGCPRGIALVPRSNAELPFMNARTLISFLPFGIRNNIEEVTRFQNYVQGRPLTAGDILSALFNIKQEQTREDLNDAEANRSWGLGAWYCSVCVTNVLSTTLFNWWKEERRNNLNTGDGMGENVEHKPITDLMQTDTMLSFYQPLE